MGGKRKRKSNIDHYNRTSKDAKADVVGGPPGSMGVLCGNHVKIGPNIKKVWMVWWWSPIENDWCISGNTVKRVIGLFSTKQSSNSKVI